MELSNEFVEDLFFQQIKELTAKTNRQLRSFDSQFSGVKASPQQVIKMKEKNNYSEELEEKADFYDETYLEDELDNDKINSIEEGFMMGYLA